MSTKSIYINSIILILLITLAIFNINSIIFYNILILPVIGAILYRFLRKKWLIGLLIALIPFSIVRAKDTYAQVLTLLKLQNTNTSINSVAIYSIIFLLIGTFIGFIIKIILNINKGHIKRSIVYISIISSVLFILGTVIINELEGNPMERYIASKEAIKYVNKNYKDLDLKLQSIKFNFKNDSYYVHVKSDTSKDTYFNVIYRNGKITDDYESSLINKTNTLMRLEDECEVEVQNILNKLYGEGIVRCSVSMDKYYEENKVPSYITADMPFENNLSDEFNLLLSSNYNGATVDVAYSMICKVYEELKNNDLEFKNYNISLYDPKVNLLIEGISLQDMRSGNLKEKIDNAKVNSNTQIRIREKTY